MSDTLIEMVRSRISGRSRLVSHVDGWQADCVHGWIFDRGDERQRQTVLVETRPGHFEAYRADHFRADVASAGIGSDGHCGFVVHGRDVSTPGPIRILSSTGKPLKGSSIDRTGRVAARVAARVKHISGGDFVCWLDRGTSWHSGWFSGRCEPGRRRTLLFKLDTTLVARQSACLHRADAPDASDPFHGFCVPRPAGGRCFRIIDEASGTLIFKDTR